MVLREHFEQRKIEPTFNSFRSMVPLATPSGPQMVESELEAELLEQLAFAPDVYDLITQPIIRYEIDGKQKRYTPDIAVQLHASGSDAGCRYLIEVKRRADLTAHASEYVVKFAAARAAAENMGAAFRIMDETQIRTPYLGNARLLQRYRRDDPDDTYERLHRMVGTRRITVAQAIALLAKDGVAEPEARQGVETAVAWRLLYCDLALPFNDATIVRPRQPGDFPDRNDDPILKALFEATCS